METDTSFSTETYSIRSGFGLPVFQSGQASDARISMPASQHRLLSSPASQHRQLSSMTSYPPSLGTQKSSALDRFEPSYLDFDALEKFREEGLYERVRMLRLNSEAYRPITHELAPLQIRPKKEKNITFWEPEEPAPPHQGPGIFQEYIDTVPTILKAMAKTKESERKFRHQATMRHGSVDKNIRSPASVDKTIRSPASECIAYAAYHGLEQLFDFLLTNLIVHKPANPLSYLIELTRSILKQMTLRVTMDMLLKNRNPDETQEEAPGESQDAGPTFVPVPMLTTESPSKRRVATDGYISSPPNFSYLSSASSLSTFSLSD